MKICFVMYPWERVEAENDSTLRLIHETASRGHTVAITTPSNLTMRDSMAIAFCNVLKKVKSQTIFQASTVKLNLITLSCH